MKLFYLLPIAAITCAKLSAKVYKLSEEDEAIATAKKENKAIAYVLG